MRRPAILAAIIGTIGLSLAGCGGDDYRATLAKCRADHTISLTPKCRDARAAAFRARFGASG